jgi:DNA-binding CsgD family transcriptional regulator
VRGTLTATFGDFDEGVRHFEVALDFCRDAGYRPELAWICHDYAAALIGRGKTRDRARIRELLDLSEPIAVQLGMTPLANMLAAHRSSVAALRRGRTEYPDALTDREVEVLRLVAAGKSNREIAQALVISENTVIRHVSNLFGKARLANRAEAVAYAIRNHLAGGPPDRA